MKPLEEKQKHLDHLHYEVTMLHYCLPEIAKREPGKDRSDAAITPPRLEISAPGLP